MDPSHAVLPPPGMMFFKGKLKPVIEVERLAQEAMRPVDRLIELKQAGAGERVVKALEWARGEALVEHRSDTKRK